MTRIHTMTTCTDCQLTGTAGCPGYALLEHLGRAIRAAGDSIDDTFEISGTYEIILGGRPCVLSYHGSRKARYLFSDTDPRDDIADLVAFAQGTLVTLHREPATVIAIEAGQSRLH